MKKQINKLPKGLLKKFKDKDYKDKGQLLSVGYYFKCTCGDMKRSNLIKPNKTTIKFGDVFGGVASWTFWCEKCGKRWHVDTKINNELF